MDGHPIGRTNPVIVSKPGFQDVGREMIKHGDSLSVYEDPDAQDSALPEVHVSGIRENDAEFKVLVQFDILDQQVRAGGSTEGRQGLTWPVMDILRFVCLGPQGEGKPNSRRSL